MERLSKTEKDNTFGKEVIDIAMQYANHEWIPTEANVFHGVDMNGAPVDTPDVTWKGKKLDCGWWKPNEKNIGVAYGWGNASTIEEFDKGILEGKYAGNVPEDKSRWMSYNSVGVDCSGLLTICWKLQKKISTKLIPEYATVIDILDIEQGDVFAKPGSHVMFFKEFLDAEKSKVRIIDSTRSTGKVSERNLDVQELFRNGYEVYRKNKN